MLEPHIHKKKQGQSRKLINFFVVGLKWDLRVNESSYWDYKQFTTSIMKVCKAFIIYSVDDERNAENTPLISGI